MGRAADVVAPSSSIRTDGGCPVAQVNDLTRSLTAFDPISTLVVVVEMSKTSWLVSGAVPGVERQPLKKLAPDATALLRLIERWRSEAVRAGRPISRIALAYEAGRDGFWLARWLIARGIEAHVGDDGARLGEIEGCNSRIHLVETLAAAQKLGIDRANLVEHLL